MIESFDDVSSQYEEISLTQNEASQYLIDLLKFNQEENVLDIGCGAGNITYKLSKQARSVVGIDISSKMIEEASTKFKQNNLSFSTISVDDISYSNLFDVVFINSAIAWMPNLAEVGSKIFNALKQGGRLGIQTSYRKKWCPQFYMAIAAAYEDPITKPILETFNHDMILHLDTAKEYLQLLEPAGFKTVHVEPVITEMIFNVKDAYQQFGSGILNAYLNNKFYNMELTKAYKERFTEILYKGLENLAVNGRVNLEYNRLYLILKKSELG
jgi:ubiquinone/menaquinone biosynthesis C-methylase UbiE